ncbi:GGDEF domain-containing protein [Aurantivibrio plasticivorans]
MQTFQLANRTTMALQFYTVVGVVVLPFVVWWLVQGNWQVSAAPGFAALLCVTNYVAHKFTGRMPISPVVISTLFVFSNISVIYLLGVSGMFWTYPILLSVFWVHCRSTALYLVVLLFITSVGTAAVLFEPFMVIRFGLTIMMIAVFFNIAVVHWEKHVGELERLTITDHLTGAFNRRFMDTKLTEMIEWQRRRGTVSTLIVLDVDHFKQVNDNYGHSVGDKVLKDLVNILINRVRSLDYVCRAGGEEFVVILPNTPETEAQLVAEDLRSAIFESVLLAGGPVSISCGISSVCPGDSPDSWLKRCDIALYQAKGEGRNRVSVSQQTNVVPNSVASA